MFSASRVHTRNHLLKGRSFKKKRGKKKAVPHTKSQISRKKKRTWHKLWSIWLEIIWHPERARPTSRGSYSPNMTPTVKGSWRAAAPVTHTPWVSRAVCVCRRYTWLCSSDSLGLFKQPDSFVNSVQMLGIRSSESLCGRRYGGNTGCQATVFQLELHKWICL